MLHTHTYIPTHAVCLLSCRKVVRQVYYLLQVLLGVGSAGTPSPTPGKAVHKVRIIRTHKANNMHSESAPWFTAGPAVSLAVAQHKVLLDDICGTLH